MHYWCVCIFLFQIVFEGVVGTGYQGDIALDDLSFTSGRCTLSPSQATPAGATTLPPTSSVSTPYVTATSCKSKTYCYNQINIHDQLIFVIFADGLIDKN